MRRRASLPFLASVLAACGPADGDVYTVVTVEARPAVGNAATLRVTLANGGTMRTDDLAVSALQFPLTFSFTAPGRTGDLAIAIDALDAGGGLVGRGATATTVGAETTSVLLDTADFVVNTEVAMDQFPSDDYRSHGHQAAATTDGTWTVAYRDDCPTPCHMFARRFDVTGRPVTSQAAAGTNGFPVSTNLTTFSSTPAVASQGTNTVEVWDYRDPNVTTTAGIACRGLDAMGRATPDQISVSTDANADVVAVTGMPNGNFALTWTGLSPAVVRGAIVRPDCMPVGGVTTVSTTASPSIPAVAAVGTPPTILYAWLVDGEIYVRIANAMGAPQGAADTKFLPKTAPNRVEIVRVAPLGTGFAVVARWVEEGYQGPGKIELYRTNAMGAVLGTPVLVSDKCGGDITSADAFGVATRADGTLMVVWQACEDSGDGSGCGVFGRAFRSDGTPLGDELRIPTTTQGDQRNPSVAALPDAFAVVWRDESMQAPDPSGAAVRARIVYPEGTGGPGQ